MQEFVFISCYVGVVVEVGRTMLTYDEFLGLAVSSLDFEGGYVG